MSFMSGIGSLFSRIGHGLMIGTGIAQEIAPQLGMIPGAGPIIVTGLNIVVALEQMFQQSGLGAQKLALAVPALTAAHPTLTTEQATAVINSLVSGLNAASKAIPT